MTICVYRYCAAHATIMRFRLVERAHRWPVEHEADASGLYCPTFDRGIWP